MDCACHTATVTELDPVRVKEKKKKKKGSNNDEHEQDDDDDDEESSSIIQVFTLELNGVVVELSSLGASITKWLVPTSSSQVVVDEKKNNDDVEKKYNKYDDIVLGYRSVQDMYESGNPPYFGVVVGRVANRIANGELWLRLDLDDDEHNNEEKDKETATATKLYQLEINNPPNHLHGGSGGFSIRIWKAQVVDIELPVYSDDDDDDASANQPKTKTKKAVQFSLLSQHMDQGYPGTVHVTATYSLEQPQLLAHHDKKSCDDANDTTSSSSSSFPGGNSNSTGARLCLTMKARLVVDDDDTSNKTTATTTTTAATPINLAQHSYFNLSRHDDPMGILHHQLQLPLCRAYTPLNEHSIPTRHVHYFDSNPSAAAAADTDEDDDAVMDFRQTRYIKDFLVEYGTSKAGLEEQQAQDAVADLNECSSSSSSSKISRRIKPNLAVSSAECRPPSAPYGLDHNYYVVLDDLANDNIPGCCPSTTLNKRNGLLRVAHLQHEQSQRQLQVWSNVPGVQVYTANYLDGTSPRPEMCKSGALYRQWQGICLETQHFPDSISNLNNNTESHADFCKGKCVILRPDQPEYEHRVEYELIYRLNDENNQSNPPSSRPPDLSTRTFRGSDTAGNSYESPDHMWRHEEVLTPDGKRDWYERAADYYAENCPETIDGVLGGFASVSQLDLEGSREFLQELQQLQRRVSLPSWSESTCCEMGAGLGRVSKGLLLPLGAKRCDLVESSSRLLSAAPDYIGDGASRCRFYCSGLQDWTAPAPKMYALVWIQWVFCYLTDDDAISFLRQCKESLVDGGLIILKENSCCNHDTATVTEEAAGHANDKDDVDDFVLDVEDASVTRSVPYLTYLADKAGLRVVLMRLQDNFPDQLFAVPMLAFEPKDAAAASS